MPTEWGPGARVGLLSQAPERPEPRGAWIQGGVPSRTSCPLGIWESVTAAWPPVAPQAPGPGWGAPVSGQRAVTFLVRSPPTPPALRGGPSGQRVPGLSVTAAPDSLEGGAGTPESPRSPVAHSAAQPLGLVRSEGRRGAGPPPGSLGQCCGRFRMRRPGLYAVPPLGSGGGQRGHAQVGQGESGVPRWQRHTRSTWASCPVWRMFF